MTDFEKWNRIAKGEKRQKSQEFDIPATFLYPLFKSGASGTPHPTKYYLQNNNIIISA